MTYESAKDISSKIALMAPQVDEAIRTLNDLKETYKTFSFATVQSRKRLVKALETLGNEYAFVADECQDLDIFFQRKVESLAY